MKITLQSYISIKHANNHIYNYDPCYISLLDKITDQNTIKSIDRLLYYHVHIDKPDKYIFHSLYYNWNKGIIKTNNKYYEYKVIPLHIDWFQSMDLLTNIFATIENRNILSFVVDNKRNFLTIRIPSSKNINKIKFSEMYYKKQLRIQIYYEEFDNAMNSSLKQLKNTFSYAIEDHNIYLISKQLNKTTIDTFLDITEGIVPKIKTLVKYLGSKFYADTIKYIKVKHLLNNLLIEINFSYNASNYLKTYYKDLLKALVLYRLVSEI